MRLIDADALTKECGDWYVEEGPEEGFIGTLEQLLSEQPEINCSEIPNNSDTISRQAAIDEITEYGSGDTVYMSVVELKRRIEQLPSAQPDIIHCKDCKYWTHIKRTNRYWCKTDDGLFDLNPSPDDFCSRGERRTDE